MSEHLGTFTITNLTDSVYVYCVSVCLVSEWREVGGDHVTWCLRLKG